MSKTLTEMAAEIVMTRVSAGTLQGPEISSTLEGTFQTLLKMQNLEEGVIVALDTQVEDVPAWMNMDPKKSIKKNMIICLECGEEFRTLSPKHLLGHGLTAKEYRKKYGFTARQPLCAKSLSDARSASGKARGIPAALAASIAKRKKKTDATV